MISEAQSGIGALGVLPIGLAALCVVGFFWFIRRSNVIPAFAFALVGAGVLAAPVVLGMKSAAANRPFEVIVVNDRISKTGFLHRLSFKGGTYASTDGREFALERSDEWPYAATLIVNDSERLITVRRYHYAASSSLTVGSPLIQVVFPGEKAVMAGYIHAMEDEGTPPPEAIKSTELADMLDILYRSNEAYDPALHGKRDDLLAERDRR